MSTTLAATNGHGGTHATASDAATHHSSGSDATQPVVPFRKQENRDPDEYVQVRVKAGSRDEFDHWYAGQHPGLRQLPDKSPWIDEVFRLGLEQIQILMPPVPSPAERLKAAREGRQS